MDRKEILKLSKKAIKDNKVIMLELPTGTGKTYISIATAFHFIKRRKEYKILILLAEIAHIDNWKKEFIKWKFPLDNVTLACYASINKFENTDWDVILLDEAHHLSSEIRLSSLSTISSKRFIIASATLTDNHKKGLYNVLGNYYNIEVSLDDAINNGTLPIPQIVLVPSKINEESNRKYIYTIKKKYSSKEITVEFPELRKIRYAPNLKDTTINVKCNSEEYYLLISSDIESLKNKYKNTRNPSIKNLWLNLASKRKDFLGKYKTRSLLRVLNSLEDKRLVCFCSCIEQAEYINKSYSIHSKKDKPLNTLTAYNQRKIDKLYAVKMLREGQNLIDTQYVIITQLDSKPLSAIQMIGRALRHSSPIIYILYVENTQDEEYLNNTILKEINSKYIKILK